MDAIKNTTKKFIKGLFKPENKLSLIPNWLSFSRVIGGIMIPIMAYTNAPISMLFGTISFLSISDFLDGLAARKIAKKETKEGAMMDAVSDKIFSLLLIIGILPILPVFALNGILEGIIALINAKILAKGGNPKSNFLGKAKIWPLSISLILGYLSLAIGNINILGITNDLLITFSTTLSIATIPLQTINIKQYFNEYKKQLKNSDTNKNNSKKNNHEINNTNENENEKEKKINLALSKEKHQAIIYQLENNPENKLENDKKLTKKTK